MTIDIDVMVTGGFFRKWMSVEQMKKCIEQLEDTDLIYPNRVGNLSIVRNSEMIGYIDFNSEQFEAV